MNRKIPKHFSHNFKLNIDRLPAKESDRLNLKILLPGILLGAALFVLGLFELLNGLKNNDSIFDKLSKDNTIITFTPFMSPVFFDVTIMILGMGIVLSLLFSHIRYKKIFFDGQNVTMVNRPAFGKKITSREDIKNYAGVMLRIEFYQCGFMTRNRYIIELHHKKPEKIVPLYISMSGKNIRKIWEDYAKKLNLPALTYTDEGMVKREAEDLGKTLCEMAETLDLKKQFNENSRHSSCIGINKGPLKIVVKSRKIIWDAYNILAWLFILMFALVGFIVSFNPSGFSTLFLWLFYGIGGLCSVAAIFILFRKDKLVIKKDKIVNTHKYMLFQTKHDEIMKKDIKAVVVTVNPATERSFLTITSDDKTIIFGKKLPMSDLKWVKKFLINEIIKDDE